MSETTAAKTVSLQAAIDGQLSPGERTSLYQSYLETEQEKILARHRAGAGGREIAGARAELLDKLLVAILHRPLISPSTNPKPK